MSQYCDTQPTRTWCTKIFIIFIPGGHRYLVMTTISFTFTVQESFTPIYSKGKISFVYLSGMQLHTDIR